MITHEKLYTALGITTSSRLKSVRRHDHTEFSFPKNSVWHHLNPSSSPTHDPLFDGIDSLYIEPVLDFVTLSSKSIEKVVKKSDLLKDIVAQTLGYDKAKVLRRGISLVKDINSVIVETYNGFENKFIFKERDEEKYLKTKSFLKSVVNRSVEISQYSERNQYFIIDLENKDTPSIDQFKKAINKLNTSTYSLFSSVDQCLMLELMKFVGGTESIFTGVSSNSLFKMNLIFRGPAKESILNMGVFLRMLDDGSEDSTGDLSPVNARRSLIKLNLVLGTEDPRPEVEEVDLDDDATDLDEIEGEGVIDIDDLDDDKIHTDLKTLERVSRQKRSTESIDIDNSPDYDPSIAIDPVVKNRIEAKRLYDEKVITFQEYEKYVNNADNLSNIPSPDGKGSLKDYIDYGFEDMVIGDPKPMKDRDTILDKSLLKSTLAGYDTKYLKEYLHKDAVKFALGIQNAGVIIKDLKVEEREDIANHYHQFTLKVELVPGGPQTITFPIPVFDERGVTEVGGVNYYLKKQDGEVPIRKTRKDQVALTSYYGKLFVDRSSSVAYNYSSFLTKHIISSGLDDDNTIITNVRVGNVFYKHTDLPRTYTAIAEKVVSFKLNSMGVNATLYFDYKDNVKRFSEDVKSVEKKHNGVVVGKQSRSGKDVFLLIGMDDALYQIFVDGTKTKIGSIDDVLVTGEKKVPIEYATIGLFGKPTPIVFLLGYMIGFGSLCKLLRVRPRIIKSGGRLDLEPGDYRVRFKNESWIFNKRDKVATLIFSGMIKYEKFISRYSSSLFNSKEVYSLLLDDIGLGKRHYVEMKVIYDLFIDHITKEHLIKMKEPTDIVRLFVRSCELLTIDKFPDEGDGRFMIIKGYERIAATVYSEIIKSTRALYSRSKSKRSRLDFNPMGVKMRLLTDSAKEVYDEINPIHAAKQQEICTLTGHGGRKPDAITNNIKGYHVTDLGIKSEANVDSGAVGITTYLSFNPKLTSLRGDRGLYDIEKDSVGSLVSTTFVSQPAMDRDDMKRGVFAGIQNSHVIPCVGYEVMPLITGGEQAITNRTDDLFAYTAKQEGIVTRLNSRVIEVTYKDGTVKCHKLGIRHGKSKGEVIPHEIVTDLKLKDKVRYGDTVCYNKLFFSEDGFSGLTMKSSMKALVMLTDDCDTHEDSFGVSSKFCKKTVSRHTVIRNVLVDFDKSIHELARVGDVLETESKLMYIEEAVTSRSGLISDDAVDILAQRSRNAPSARVSGVIDKIEIRYRGETDDMSQSLQEIAHTLDRTTARDRRDHNKKVITNKADESFRVDGNPLGKDQAVIIFYISSDVHAGTGDKFIIGNQMKGTVSRVINEKLEDSYGRSIDIKMATAAYDNRMVDSIKLIGSTTEGILLIQDILLKMLDEE